MQSINNVHRGELSMITKLALAIVACIVLSAPARAEDPAQVDRPALKPGDAWTYVRLDPFSKVQQDEIVRVVATVDDKEARITDQANVLKAVYDSNHAATFWEGESFSPPIRALTFPMTVGMKWDHVNGKVHPKCGNTSTQLKNEVIGWEDVKVPAGSFRTLRIDSQGYWSNGCGSGRLAYKFWYSPQAKWWVRTESFVYAGTTLLEGSLRELKAFKPAPAQ
jgi:hypothetical protein